MPNGEYRRSPRRGMSRIVKRSPGTGRQIFTPADKTKGPRENECSRVGSLCAVTLLVDSSQSMHGGLLDRARAAAVALIDQLPADSLVEVLSFSEHPAIRYPMGGDHEQAQASLEGLSSVGST